MYLFGLLISRQWLIYWWLALTLICWYLCKSNDWFADILAMILINLLIFCQWLWLWFADICVNDWFADILSMTLTLICWYIFDCGNDCFAEKVIFWLSMTVVFVPTAYLPLQQMCACLPAKSWSGCATFPNIFIKRRAQRQYPLLLYRGNW